ncbi:MAG TPA: response regulator transcription factor [Candidatus Limnocylindrales bacterium]|nr:response regulator transcription factor [Candidatus Limnocylindrales bacterium]
MTDSAAAPAPLRVLLVDTDERVRESLAGLLRIGHRCLVVGSAGSADEALRLAGAATPDVVVVDPRLPGPDAGAAFIARIRAVAPDARILVLKWSESADDGSGADFYARKTFRSHELIDAVLSTAGRPVS